jgi:hypothetical protein
LWDQASYSRRFQNDNPVAIGCIQWGYWREQEVENPVGSGDLQQEILKGEPCGYRLHTAEYLREQELVSPEGSGGLERGVARRGRWDMGGSDDQEEMGMGPNPRGMSEEDIHTRERPGCR